MGVAALSALRPEGHPVTALAGLCCRSFGRSSGFRGLDAHRPGPGPGPVTSTGDDTLESAVCPCASECPRCTVPHTKYTKTKSLKSTQTTQTNVRSASRRQLSQAAGTLLLLLLHRLVYCKATLSLPCADTERGPAAGTTGGLSEDCAAHDNDNATPRSAASFSQRPHGRYHCACLVFSCLVVHHYTSPHLSWWTVQGSPPPASTIANSPQLQLHLSRVSFLRGRGMLARWNCPVCAAAASLRPNDSGIDGWQAATCYSPALARPAPRSLHCHRLSPLLGALQMFPEQSA